MLSLHLNKIAMETWYHLTRCDRRVFKDFFLEHGWNFATTSGCTKVHPNSDRNDNEVQVISDTSHTDQGSATHRRKYASTVPQWINTPCYVLLRQTIITSFFFKRLQGNSHLPFQNLRGWSLQPHDRRRQGPWHCWQLLGRWCPHLYRSALQLLGFQLLWHVWHSQLRDQQLSWCQPGRAWQAFVNVWPNCQTHANDRYLEYFQWNCPQINATRFHR